MRGVYLSAIDGLPGLHGHADLLAVLGFEADARRLARLGVRDRDLADVPRRFLAFESALRVLLVRLFVAGDDISARSANLAVLREDLGHCVVFALFLSGPQLKLVVSGKDFL